jgi:hypothetical protein
LIFVDGLFVLGSGGGAGLVGQVAGVGGTFAAAVSGISPAVDPAYLMNGCAIGSNGCLPPDPPLPRPPQVSQLPIVTIVSVPFLPPPLGWLMNPDLVPPNIANQDY